MRNGPELWRNILKGMPPGSIIAGGSVRDFMLGFKPKDIDVFAPKLKEPVPDFRDISDDGVEGVGYNGISNVESVYRSTIYGYTIDLVEMETFDPETITHNFDSAIVRCWFDGEIHDTPEAALDRLTKSVTILNNSRPERSRERFRNFNRRNGEQFTLREKAK